ncbi:NAD(P)H-dependent oxidoreductase [Opitutales bacterium ASA1]|uniref:NADPH-dependent FMN reductase n=1 Tax=Congregicoccus parvus TaxID=3081749 RepID=UPI002B2F4690|nr:NAD(P)H-dependent oxidoreductase [Opitutales bacterium ASA1]
MKILILSTSLNPRSRSRLLARRAEEHLEAVGAETCFVDLQELELPFCGADGCYADPQVVALQDRIREAHAVLVASPVYNYDVNAACKNVLELTGDAWEDKVVGFLCAAGGASSYMSIMGLANSLMLDFRCVVVPRFVYATGAAFKDGALADPEVARRTEELCERLLRLARALSDA